MRTIGDLVRNGQVTRNVKVKTSTFGSEVLNGEVAYIDQQGNVFIVVGPLQPEDLTVVPPEKDYAIHVEWKMDGIFKVKATSMEEAIEKVKYREPPYDRQPQTQDEVDHSMNVVKERCEEWKP